MKTALITGGSRGLGKALAAQLADHGWRLVITGRDRNALDEALTELPGGTVGVQGDVSDAAHRRNLADHVGEGLDLLVNNASELGPSPLVHLADIDDEALISVFTVNVVAPISLIRSVAPHLSSGGVIVNISSDAAVEAYPTWGAYGASKAALDHATKVLAAERPDLSVYSFDPGDMRTEMHQAAFPGEDISDRPEPETVAPALLDLIERRPPSGRYRAVDHLTGATT